MANPTYRQLQDAAKKAGINPFGMKKSDLMEQVGHLVSAETVSRETAPRRDAERPAREDAARQRRVPLGMPRQKLDYPKRDGYVRRWFNDNRNRIHDAERAGYQFVLEERDGRDVKVSQLVGTKEDGSPMVAYLMEIRQEFYDEDQAAKEAINAEVDEQIMRRIEPEGTGDADRGRFYEPSEGRSMKAEVS